MKADKKTLPFILGVGFFGAVFGSIFSTMIAFAWTGPTQTPPGGNTDTPVNVGLFGQVKAGTFWASAIGADSGYCIGSSCIAEWPFLSSGSSAPLYASEINVTTDATSTFLGGINITSGCISVNGTCISTGEGVRFLKSYAITTAGSGTVVFTGAPDSDPVYAGGTLTLPSNTQSIVVHLWGAGGGGGGGASNGDSGAGGGAGGYVMKLYTAPLASQYNYSIGVGGIGYNNAQGTNGTASTFASLTAGGGEGGSASNRGGTGGTASGGDINIAGGGGGGGADGWGSASGGGGVGGSTAGGGAGGGCGGGAGGTSSNNPCPGVAPGGGGGGAGGYLDGSSTKGAVGGSGGVTIDVYVSTSGSGGSGGGGGSDTYWTLSGASLYNNSGTNVGIGTAAPSAKLTIGGTAGVDGIKFPDGTLQTAAAGADSLITTVRSNRCWDAWCEAQCPAGYTVISGGWDGYWLENVDYNGPDNNNTSWGVGDGSYEDGYWYVYAICMKN